MALQHLRSSTANKRPTPGVMSDGQLAMNTNLASPGLFLKDSNSDLVKVGPIHVGTTAPNVTPAVGGQAGNSKGEQWLDTTGGTYVLKVWDGTQWCTTGGGGGGATDLDGLTDVVLTSPSSGQVLKYNGTNWVNGTDATGGGGGGATGGGSDQVFYENDQVVTTSYTLTVSKNAVTAGPITINTGVTVTVPSGASWVVV